MSRYEHLPIYKKAFDLLVYLEGAIRHFPRYHKYTLGTDIRTTAQKMVYTLATLNDAPMEKRGAVVAGFLQTVERAKIQLAVARETAVFKNYDTWYRAAEQLHDIGGQGQGLKGYFDKRAGIGENSLPSAPEPRL